MISIFFLLTRRYQSPSKFILVIFSVKGVNFFRDITRIFSRWSVHIRRRPRISEDVTKVLTFVLNAFPSKIRDFLNSIRSFTHTFLFSHWFEFMLFCIFFENLSVKTVITSLWRHFWESNTQIPLIRTPRGHVIYVKNTTFLWTK